MRNGRDRPDRSRFAAYCDSQLLCIAITRIQEARWLEQVREKKEKETEKKDRETDLPVSHALSRAVQLTKERKSRVLSGIYTYAVFPMLVAIRLSDAIEYICATCDKSWSRMWANFRSDRSQEDQIGRSWSINPFVNFRRWRRARTFVAYDDCTRVLTSINESRMPRTSQTRYERTRADKIPMQTRGSVGTITQPHAEQNPAWYPL